MIDAPRPVGARRRPRRSARWLAALCVGAILTASCAGPEPEPSPTTSAPSPAELAKTPSKLFGSPPDNPFLTDVSQAPVHGNSTDMMRDLLGQIAASNGSVALNTGHYNSTLWVADADTRPVRIAFDNCQKKPDVPDGLYDGPKYFVDVPMPDAAAPAKGTDGALTVWSPDADRLWEFWVAKEDAAGTWSACWGGRIDGLAQSHGAFPNPFGASASGLATVGSMISVEEARRGRIDHAINIGLRTVGSPSRVYYPANRSDGKGDSPASIPMGARLRLDPSIDVNALDLTPLGKAVARAAQTYGFLVTETSGTVGLGAESGQAERQRTGTDPWKAILGDVPDYAQLDDFPWDRLQVLEAGYGAPEDVPSPSTSG